MGELVPLQANRRRPESPGPMPERFSPEERRRLLEWAAKQGFSFEEVRFAVVTVRDWWETRRQPRVAWVRVVMRAMREGWGLRGFKQWQARQPHPINPRTGLALAPRTPITPELVEQLCAAKR